jgi:hypothetical protein
MCGRQVRLTTSKPSVSQLSRNVESSTTHNIIRPLRPVTGETLLQSQKYYDIFYIKEWCNFNVHWYLHTNVLYFFVVLWTIRLSGLFPFWISLKLLHLQGTGRAHWTENQSVARPLRTQNTNTDEKRTDANAPRGIRTNNPSDRVGEDIHILDHTQKYLKVVVYNHIGT